MEEQNLYIAQVVKKIRISHNLSQKRLAVKLGVSEKTVSAYELGRILPSVSIINKLSRMFGVSFSNDYVKRKSEKEIKIRFDRLKDALTQVEELLNKGLSF